MTTSIQQSIKEQLKDAMKDLSFAKAFNRMRLHDLKRLKTRKNLLLFSMAYGAAIVLLATLIF